MCGKYKLCSKKNKIGKYDVKVCMCLFVMVYVSECKSKSISVPSDERLPSKYNKIQLWTISKLVSITHTHTQRERERESEKEFEKERYGKMKRKECFEHISKEENIVYMSDFRG